MDIVFIKGLKARATVGVYEWERHIRQQLLVDLELRADVSKASKTDALEDTVDYKAISHRVVEFIETSQYRLVESIAEALAEIIQKEFGVSWLRLRISKPFAVRTAQEVGVVIERGE